MMRQSRVRFPSMQKRSYTMGRFDTQLYGDFFLFARTINKVFHYIFSDLLVVCFIFKQLLTIKLSSYLENVDFMFCPTEFYDI